MDVYIAIDEHQKYMHIYTHIFTQSSYMLLLYLNCCFCFLYLSYQNTVAHRYPSDLVKHSKLDPTSSAVLAYL